MKFKTGQVRGASGGGSGEVGFTVSGFTPRTTAHLALVGWSLKYTNPDHHIHEIGIYTKKAVVGGWEWANEFPVDNAGAIHPKYVAMCNDDNDDDPFTFLINYLAIGE